MTDEEILNIFNNNYLECHYCGKEGRVFKISLEPLWDIKEWKEPDQIKAKAINYLISVKCWECARKESMTSNTITGCKGIE